MLCVLIRADAADDAAAGRRKDAKERRGARATSTVYTVEYAADKPSMNGLATAAAASAYPDHESPLKHGTAGQPPAAWRRSSPAAGAGVQSDGPGRSSPIHATVASRPSPAAANECLRRSDTASPAEVIHCRLL